MRARGWVKPAFAGKLTRFTSHRISWDPVAEAIEEYFTEGLGSLGYLQSHQSQIINLGYACSEIRRGWACYNRFIALTLTLAGICRQYGIDFFIGGRKVDCREDVEAGIILAGHLDVTALEDIPIESLCRELRTGIVRSTRLDPLRDVEDKGFVLALMGDDAPGRTARAFLHIRQCHEAGWRREMDTLAARRAGELLSVFRGMQEGVPELADWITEAGRAELLDTCALQVWLLPEIDVMQRDPPDSAHQALKAAEGPILRIIRDLEVAFELASEVGDADLAVWIRHQALATLCVKVMCAPDLPSAACAVLVTMPAPGRGLQSSRDLRRGAGMAMILHDVRWEVFRRAKMFPCSRPFSPARRWQRAKLWQEFVAGANGRNG